VPASRVARETIEARFGREERAVHKLPFVALGRSGHHTTARDLEEIIKAEWTVERLVDSGRNPA